MKKFIFILLITHCSLVVVHSQSGWFQQTSGTTRNLYSVNFNHGNNNKAWACGELGIILYTANGGANWVMQNSGTVNTLYAICFMETAGGPVIAVGENGTILRTTNEGFNWIQISSPTSRTLRDISDFNFIAAGDSGTVIRSTNSGLTWTVMSSSVNTQLNAVACLGPYYAAGNGGVVIRSTNQGLSWQLVNTGVSQNLYGLPLFAFNPTIAGANGLILRSSNAGNSWYMQNTGTNNALRSLEFSSNNEEHIYCVGDNGTIIKSTNNGATWGFQQSSTLQNLNSTFFYLNDNTGYAAGNSGTILKTTDGGGPIITAVDHSGNEIPERFSLYQNYPNPFNPVTRIRFDIPAPQGVLRTNLKSEIISLKLYDVLGREVETILESSLQPGTYEVEWDASNYSSGVYYYRLTAGDVSVSSGQRFMETKKMILMK